METVSTAAIPSSTDTTVSSGTATCTHFGAPRRVSHPRRGATAITNTNASTTGPAIEPTARNPANVITAPANPSSTITVRGIALSATPVVLPARKGNRPFSAPVGLPVSWDEWGVNGWCDVRVIWDWRECLS
ncbi:hypothetical protein Ssi02_17080 [Sinosporangium siamense]|uniref:Uncharacterized protein n=1 Tax=Sinosporangium siamense TaxID=1367973 RepID=A0A919RD30_9ACTN|nr:hypothetical protein Ssi02_17080 [Sinosporangium siamense]